MKKLPGLLLLFALGCSDQKDSTTDIGTAKNENGVPQYTEIKTGGVKMIPVDGKYQ